MSARKPARKPRRRRDQLPPSLGRQVCDWMEDQLVHGPGDVQGREYRLTDEQRAFIWRAYELRPDGRRRYRRAVYSRRKGVAKTEMAAAIAGAELAGPVRFDGWDARGEPVGRPVASPDIPAVATAEDQADLVYSAARVMLTEGPMSVHVDAGLERINLIGRPGKLYLVTSRAGTREGGRQTFIPADETHLWIAPELKELHRVLRRNLAKRKDADPWMLETTVAYRPGEASVAEGSHEYGMRVLKGEVNDPSLLFDHLEAGPDHDLATDDGLAAAILEASGLAAAWTSVEAIVDDFRDPQNSEVDGRRYWLNQIVEATDQWISPSRWEACAAPKVKVAAGEQITLGFDGSLYDDATALVGCRLSDGHLFPLGIWERPAGAAGAGWQTPGEEVDARVHEAFTTYRVVRFHADPPYWQEQVDGWYGEWGDVVVAWWTHKYRQMAIALERLHTAVMKEAVTHNGDPTLARHVANARTYEHRSGVLIRKPRRQSPHKIDGAMAATLAYEARADAIADGALKPPRSRVPHFA